MTEIINQIINKPDWQKKILNKNIIDKWYNEAKNNNISIIKFKSIIDLLLKSIAKKEFDNDIDELDDYDSPIFIKTNGDEFGIASECKCECRICVGEECTSCGTEICKSDCEEEEQRARDGYDLNNYLDPQDCKCNSKKLNKKKQVMIDTYINENNCLIDKFIKQKLNKNVLKYEQTKEIDFHPGSDNKIIDIVHPSLYCYVKDVTKINFKMDKNVLYQWLPSDFTVNKHSVAIDSYINNLDPCNEKLYNLISYVFYQMVPQFNDVLEQLEYAKRISKSTKLKKCQVIVKLANTFLTPDSSSVNAGSWHLEGIQSEKIIATGIYYYNMVNVSDNYLHFRTTIDCENANYPQNGIKYVKKHYGSSLLSDDRVIMGNESETQIYLGKIKTYEDLCLVFPNFLQHRVSEFELLDKTKPGIRKTLIFFLIDPSQNVISTSDVSPQQTRMTYDDACFFRELLMYERKYEVTSQNVFFERSWSLCEH